MLINKNIKVLLIFIILVSLVGCSKKSNNKISLAGQWYVRLDSTGIGEVNGWAAENFTKNKIKLPGTLDDAGLGTENKLKPAINNYVLSHLARKHQYIGAAWYQRVISIPESWKYKSIELELERVIWESKVYIDGSEMGMQESLITPHYYNLTGMLTPGKHTLTIRIDNSEKYPFINVHGTKYPDPISMDMAHAYTNHTQIKWNGIIGKLFLIAREKVNLKNAQIFSNQKNNQLKVQVQIDNSTGKAWPGEILYNITDRTGTNLLEGSKKVNIPAPGKIVNLSISSNDPLGKWDEFNPTLYTLDLALQSNVNETSDSLHVKFGIRDPDNKNGVLTLNGHRIFLRGNLDCAIFPLTGYPYTNESGWMQIIQTAKSYGLNHFRFHSWCPPNSAFKAADELGFYLQVELPHWSDKVGKDERATEFIKKEADKLLSTYGNHPSFLLLSLGNELRGDAALMNNMVRTLREKDNRHLYTTTTFSFQRGMGKYPQPQDEFFITQYTDKGWVRGQGIFNSHPPNFNKDYSAVIDSIKVPLISHEIGQYSVFPDMNEIEKYTGVLQPLNFIAIRNDLKKKGLLELADDFTQASGKLAALLYKEEIERALKTPGFDGFQLLQLQDFPGQGTALVGLLNAFWESKGIISPGKFREFCSEVVPLLRFEKAVYTDGETFEATVEVANFFKEIDKASLIWQIKDEKENIIGSGAFKGIKLDIGNNKLGQIRFPVQTAQARRLTVSLLLNGTPYKNSWPIWVYPKAVPTEKDNILATDSFEEAKKALFLGKRVLLTPTLQSLRGIEGRFVPVFWSPVHFPNQPGTMGILCRPDHPALKHFPTRSYTEWQWWDLCIQSKSIITDSLAVKPIVRVIDNFVTNHRLTNLFEAKVGKGRLVFSSIDLEGDLRNRPVARQLLHSLLMYMDSENFHPADEISFKEIENLLIHK